MSLLYCSRIDCHCFNVSKTLRYLFENYFPAMNVFSINRVTTDEIKNLLNFKCSMNSVYFINQSNGWTLNNGVLDFLLFYSGILYLVKKKQSWIWKIYSKTNWFHYYWPRNSKLLQKYSMLHRFQCESKDFPTLSCNVPGCNSVYFSKSIFKVVGTSSVHPGRKPISDTNVSRNKSCSKIVFSNSQCYF